MSLRYKDAASLQNKLNMREGKQYQRRHIEKRNFHFRESWTVDIHKNKVFSSQNHYIYPLFVFSINGLKQNARSLLAPFSDTDSYPLLHGSLHFVLHGSSNNRLFQRFWLAVEDFQPIRRWLKKLPWRAKPRLPCERAWITVPETGVKSDLAFCLGSLNEKTNSGVYTTCKSGLN